MKRKVYLNAAPNVQMYTCETTSYTFNSVPLPSTVPLPSSTTDTVYSASGVGILEKMVALTIGIGMTLIENK